LLTETDEYSTCLILILFILSLVVERERLFEELSEHPDIGFGFRSILPSEISRSMLRKSTDVYNLNQMSHDATITLIRKIIDNGKVKVKTAYIDTVGNPQSYQRKLEREFPDIQFVVESKADANYAPCSAASVGKIKCTANLKLTAINHDET